MALSGQAVPAWPQRAGLQQSSPASSTRCGTPKSVTVTGNLGWVYLRSQVLERVPIPVLSAYGLVSGYGLSSARGLWPLASDKPYISAYEARESSVWAPIYTGPTPRSELSVGQF